MSKSLYLPPAFAALIRKEVDIIMKKVKTGTKVTFDNPYMMSARHRGDMYQMRASMALLPRGIILYESDPAEKGSVTRDVEEYLMMSAQVLKLPILIVTWPRQAFETGAGLDTLNYLGCTLNGKQLVEDKPISTPCTFITEGDATEQLFLRVISPQKMKGVIDHMALPGNTTAMEFLGKSFSELAPQIFPKLKGGTKHVLILHRDTGAGGGAYPELDSGDAIDDFAHLVDKVSTEETPLSPLLVGNKPTKDDKFPSIGQYWLRLKDLVDHTKLPKREIEAYFMKWAFANNYFHMVLGFRSGMLDFYTLIGVPTVSVGLRFLAGEGRHLRLAQEIFKRVNVAYDQPRHNTTAWVKSRRPGELLLQSPFWLEDAPDGITPRVVPPTPLGKADLIKVPPGSFIGIDSMIVEMGFRIACERELGMEKTILSLSAETRAINIHVMRSIFPIEAQNDALEEYIGYFERTEAFDKQTISDRIKPARAQALQQTGEKSTFYQTECSEDWSFIKLTVAHRDEIR
jgi:hypothetical protein